MKYTKQVFVTNDLEPLARCISQQLPYYYGEYYSARHELRQIAICRYFSRKCALALYILQPSDLFVQM